MKGIIMKFCSRRLLKINSFRLLIVSLVLGIWLLASMTIMAEESMVIKVDGITLEFTEATGQPFIDQHNRTQVPVRQVLESYGAEVNWNSEDCLVEIIFDAVVLEIPIGEKRIVRNGQPIAIDSAALIQNNRTYLPIRCVIEALGGLVAWDGADMSVNIDHPLVSEAMEGLGPFALGISTSQILSNYGQPDLQLPSVYGFVWWVYRNDYEGYMQLGVYQDSLEAILITDEEEAWPYKLKVGMGLDEAEDLGVTKSSKSWYCVDKLKFSDAATALEDGDVTLWPFIDDMNCERIYSVVAVKSDYGQRWSADGYKVTMTSQSYEQQIYEITNVFRVSKGLEPLTMDPDLSKVARNHSEDMQVNQFFSHTNNQGESPFDRMAEAGFNYLRASENIACGQSNAINAMDAWINSEGHRLNLLSDYQSVGIGFSEGFYYTQNFIGDAHR